MLTRSDLLARVEQEQLVDPEHPESEAASKLMGDLMKIALAHAPAPGKPPGRMGRAKAKALPRSAEAAAAIAAGGAGG